MNDKKILVPVDGSYKEYEKYNNAFRGTDLWNNMIFLVDSTLDCNSINNAICLDDEYKSTEVNYQLCDQILKKCGFDGTLDHFCIVEYYQNKMLYHTRVSHREDVAKKLIFLYDFLRKIDFEVFVYNTVSHFFPRFTSLVARAIGKEVYGYTQSLVPGSEFVWVSDEQFYCDELIDSMRTIDQSLCARSKTILQEIKEKKKKKRYLSVCKRSVFEEFKSLIMIRNRLKLKTLTKARLKYWLNKLVINKCRAFFWKKSSIETLPSIPFVFFPLHMPGESQTLVRGYPFINDVDVLEQISLILPSKFVLLVKEHPGYEGWKSLKELDTINNLPNVYLLNSTISSHEIIERSECVVTINSSVWFESLAFETPVITLGRGTFTGTKITNQVSSYDELREAFKKLESDPDSLSPDVVNVEKFLSAYIDVSVGGGFYDYTDNYISTFRRLIQNKIRMLVSND